jgi:tRNA-specific 2-thiouridylase
MKRARLERTLLPIGGYRKADVRAMAKEMGLPTFDKPDSQEICFVPDNDYAGLVERRRGEAVSELPPGAVVDAAGNKVGEHGGQHRFTIGQRRRVGVALGYPVFVVGKDVEKNTVTVGPREMLFARGLSAGEVNWLIDEPVSGEWRACSAKVRSNSKPTAARMRWQPDRGELEVEFEEAVEAIAPGQAVVVYDGERVLGGGWIRGVERARE